MLADNDPDERPQHGHDIGKEPCAGPILPIRTPAAANAPPRRSRVAPRPPPDPPYPRGRQTVKVVPSPKALSTATRPPWFSATCLTMLRPRPVPPVSLERALSTR